MYKIYINKTAVILSDQPEKYRPVFEKNKLIANYLGRKKDLLHYIDLAEKSDKIQEIILQAKDPGRLKEDFFSLYKIIKAAGGLVFNDNNEMLVMYRRGNWDLPKGKIDKGERKKEAAIREVREETGLQDVSLGQQFHITYHTYGHPKHGRVLKPTFWYTMTTSESDLVPQTEEDIEQMIWIKKEDFLKKYRSETYQSILDVVENPAV